MRLTVVELLTDPPEFKVIDATTGARVEDVLWVDDATLEYAVLRQPPTYHFKFSTGESGWEHDVLKADRVTVNYAAAVITLNEPQPRMATTGITVRELNPCGECRQADCCRRIDWCAAFRCGFGQENRP